MEPQEYSDATNVDIEGTLMQFNPLSQILCFLISGSYDEVTNLRYMIDNGRRSLAFDIQESRSNSSSPTDGAGGYTTPKKRDKTKKRNKGKGSPSTSLFD